MYLCKKIYKAMVTQDDYIKVVNDTLSILEENPEWMDRYERYAQDIMHNKSYKGFGQAFRVKAPLYVYSSISKATEKGKKSKFDLRCAGQSVGTITVYDDGGKEVCLLTVSDEQAKYAHKCIGYKGITGFTKEWRSKEADEYRRAFVHKKTIGEHEVYGKEHRIENMMLNEFGKTRAKGAHLCYIKPVTLGGKFFQLSTPISASVHSEPPKYSGAYGGGIDILARANHKGGAKDNRLVIMELKDENKKEEPQAEVLKQAYAYAAFVACLLRSKCGKKWWNLFGKKGGPTEELIIDVVTLMPAPKSEEGPLVDILLEKLGVVLHPSTLYFEYDGQGITGFSGKYPGELMNNGN